LIVRAASPGQSLIDVPGELCLGIWLCGCNLRCRFCHNWRIADGDPSVCREFPLEELVREVEIASAVATCLLASGGEPLLQLDAVIELGRAAKRLGMFFAVETNATLPRRLERLVRAVAPDAVFLDVKAPPEVAGDGYDPKAVIESLRVLRRLGVSATIRVPTYRELYESCPRYREIVAKAVEEALSAYPSARVERIWIDSSIAREPGFVNVLKRSLCV